MHGWVRTAAPLAAVIVGLTVRAGADEARAGAGEPPPRSAEPPAEAVLADLPFLEHPEPHRIVVDLAKEGARPLRFFVDTGASHTVATPRAAADLGIRVRRTKRDPYRRSTRLGRDVQILVDTRSSDTASRTGHEYALLGGQFLAEYVVELDFAGRRVRLLDPERYEVPEAVQGEGRAVLPLTLRMNRPGVEIELNGNPTLVLVDTGAPVPAVLSGDVADSAGISPSETGRFRSYATLGPMISELRVVERLELGRFSFPGVAVVVNPRGWYNLGMPGDSVIGYELLALFRVRIDYPRRRLWLERDPEAPVTFLGRAYRDLPDLLAQLGAAPEGDEPSTDATPP